MSNEKNISTRLIHKHDIEANWKKATGFIPKAGEMIVYDTDDNYNYSRIKIGDGVSNVNDLLFTSDTLAYSKYGEPIILDTDNTTVEYPNLNLIGSKVIDEAPGRRRLKTPLTKPEEPCAIADNEYLSINYLNMDMFNKPVLILMSERFPMFCPSLSPNTFGVFYTFEDVALNADAGTSRLFCKANNWYSIEIPKNENDIIKIEPFDLEKNPITLPSFSEVNNYFYECTEAADIIEYTITHKHIIQNDNSFMINNQTIHQDYTNYSDSLLILYLLNSISFMYEQNDHEIQFQFFSVGIPSKTKLTIMPLLEKKQIDSNYIQLAQPDYHQNDMTQPDYIKNRLAYTDYELIQLFDINVVNKNANGLLEYTTEEYPLFLQEGKTYLVSDGLADFNEPREYICEKITVDNNNCYTIGNPAVLPGANITSTSSVQWCIVEQKLDNEFVGWGIFFGDNNYRNEVRMQLRTQEEVIHPVPEKYIMPTLLPLMQEFSEQLDTKQNTITGAASTITETNLNPDKVIVSDSQGKLSSSSITTDELNSLKGLKDQILFGGYADNIGALTWDGIIDNQYIAITRKVDDNIVYHMVQITDKIPENFNLALNAGVVIGGISFQKGGAIYDFVSLTKDEDFDNLYWASTSDDTIQVIIALQDVAGIANFKKGIYFSSLQNLNYSQSLVYVSSLNIPGYSFTTNSKYLPLATPNNAGIISSSYEKTLYDVQPVKVDNNGGLFIEPLAFDGNGEIILNSNKSSVNLSELNITQAEDLIGLELTEKVSHRRLFKANLLDDITTELPTGILLQSDKYNIIIGNDTYNGVFSKNVIYFKSGLLWNFMPSYDFKSGSADGIVQFIIYVPETTTVNATVPYELEPGWYTTLYDFENTSLSGVPIEINPIDINIHYFYFSDIFINQAEDNIKTILNEMTIPCEVMTYTITNNDLSFIKDSLWSLFPNHYFIGKNVNYKAITLMRAWAVVDFGSAILFKDSLISLKDPIQISATNLIGEVFKKEYAKLKYPVFKQIDTKYIPGNLITDEEADALIASII